MLMALALACGPDRSGAAGPFDDLAPPRVTGAQALPPALDAEPVPQRIFHVATSGNDAWAGSADRPWRTIGRAVAGLRAGDAVHVHPGRYPEHLDLSSGDGQPDAPIWLLGAPGEARPVVRATADRPILRLTRAHWVVAGLDVDGAGRQAHAFRIEGARQVVVRDNLIHGGSGPAAVAIFGGARDVTLLRNRISDYRWQVGGRRKDSHGILVLPDAERVLIRQNEAWGMSGDAVQCQGVSEHGTGSADPRDITIEDNRFHHNAENAVDIKSCERVTIRGGGADGSKLYGYRPADDVGGNCGGAAIVLHYRARDILVENNRIWDSGVGIAVGRDDALARDIVIRRNAFFGLVQDGNGCGDAIRLGRAAGVEIYNNTFDRVPRHAVQLGLGGRAGASTDSVRVSNNIVRDAAIPFAVNRAMAPGFRSDRNVFWNRGAQVRLSADGVAGDLARWRTATGQDGTSRAADPLLSDRPEVDDYYTRAGSPARDAALDLDGPSYCGTGPDIGFLESCGD
jgi:hypothetical protein